MDHERITKLLDLLPAALFFALGAWLYVETYVIGDEFAIGIGMDAGTYPQVLAIALLVLSALLAVRVALGYELIRVWLEEERAVRSDPAVG